MEPITLQSILKYLSDTGEKLSSEDEKMLESIWKASDTQQYSAMYCSDSYGMYQQKYFGDPDGGDGNLNPSEWAFFKQQIEKKAVNLYNKLKNYISNVNKKTWYLYTDPHQTIDKDMLSEEVLKEQFSEDSYDIEITKNEDEICYDIRDKKNPSEDFTIIVTKDFVRIKTKVGRQFTYDKDARLVSDFLTTNKSGIQFDYENNRKYIYSKDNDLRVVVNLENGEVIWKKSPELISFESDASRMRTKKDFENLFSRLNKDNIMELLSKDATLAIVTNYIGYHPEDQDKKAQLLNMYLEKAKDEGIYTADIEEAFAHDTVLPLVVNYTYYIRKLENRIEAKKYYNTNIDEPDGIIDKNSNFYQGNTGDCWLIQFIKNLSCNSVGVEVLNDMLSVQKDENGNIVSETVTIQGKDYDIPYEQIKGSIEYSSGDADVRAIEIAVFRYLEEIGGQKAFQTTTQSYVLNPFEEGGTASMASEIFFGDGLKIKLTPGRIFEDNTIPVDEAFIEKLKNTNNFVANVGAGKSGYSAIDIDTGEAVDIYSEHAYGISSYDDEYIYIYEPISAKTLKMGYQDFLECFDRGDIAEIVNKNKH